MKAIKLGLLLSLCTLVLGLIASSCGSVYSREGGLNDESYIVVSSNKDYIGRHVFVFVDNSSESIRVLARREGDKTTRRGDRVVVTPGRHRIAVGDREGHRFFDKEIFVSTRTTKTIVIP